MPSMSNMDTPEGDVFAIQSGAIESLPAYFEEETALTSLQAFIGTLPPSSSHLHPLDQATINAFIESQTMVQPGTKSKGPPEPIMDYPRHVYINPTDEVMRIQEAIVTGFFDAISKGWKDVIAMFINNNLVSVETTNRFKKTPLLAAIDTKNVQIVQWLIGFGADVNAFGVEAHDVRQYPFHGIPIKRTPLQLAASIGHLPLVKFLMEVHHADDSLIAPDGQIALRLAAENGHREVVDYLPARRGGGFRRWQYHHQKAIQRTKRALKKIYKFGKFFLWDIEKFFLWTCPKHLIVKPVVRACTWCWKNKHFLGPWCAHQMGKMPGRAKRLGKLAWRGVKAVPEAVADVGREVWKFCTATLPRWAKNFALWVWSLFTTRFPKAVAIASKWIWAGVKSMAKAVMNIILQAMSVLHTVFEALLTFFRNLTLKDIWDGFCSLLHTIFVAIPKTFASWAVQFSEISYKIMKSVFGEIGEVLWWIVYGLGWLATYVPRKFWVVLQSLGSSFAKGWYEAIVFFKPKA